MRLGKTNVVLDQAAALLNERVCFMKIACF